MWGGFLKHVVCAEIMCCGVRVLTFFIVSTDSAGTLTYLTTVLLLSLSVNWKQNAI